MSGRHGKMCQGITNWLKNHAVSFFYLFFEMILWDFYDSFPICQAIIPVLRSNKKGLGDLLVYLSLSNWQIHDQELQT
jgi:hypothetical protein